MNRLAAYLDQYGLLLCNVNPDLPALDDIGADWQDVTALMDAHGLFYSKVFRGRTTYTSPEVYYLLKQLKPKKPLTDAAARIYDVLAENPTDMTFLKQLSGLPPREFQRGFQFLLQNLAITAVQNGTPLQDNWSTFVYGTASTWEKYTPHAISWDAPRDRLWEILSQTMTDRQIQSLLR